MFLLVMTSNMGALHNVKLIGKIARRKYLKGHVVVTNHYPVHIRWLPIWFAGYKPEPNWMLFMQFS